MISRLPVLGAITVMTLNCGVAVAGPKLTSADYVMPGCREAASLITFSNVGESEEQASLMGFCAGTVVGLSFMGQPYGICVPPGHDFSASHWCCGSVYRRTAQEDSRGLQPFGR
jgi:hypothetical protein